MKTLTEEFIDQQIQKNYPGSKRLSPYINSITPIQFVCANGHFFTKRWLHAKHGSWCLQCSGIVRHTLNNMKLFVKEKYDGECLSEKYINNRVKLQWKCKKGHIWMSRPSSVLEGYWCPECGGCLPLKLEDIKKFVKDKYNGECLSETYKNSKINLIWKCDKGHIWETKVLVIKNGTWCPYCKGHKKSIKDMQKLAENNGGKCISTIYKNAYSILTWQCKIGHVWATRADDVAQGHWCPECCSTGIKEKMTRYIFEKMFGYKFEKIRPQWLINNKTGKKLELDGYCKELKMAFEYQGIQHYKVMKEFKMTETDLQDIQARDKYKLEKCNEMGILLFQIPYYTNKFKPENLPDFIANQIDKKIINTDINLSDFWKTL